MLREKLSSVFTVLFTPFDKKGEIDEQSLRRNISFLVEKSEQHKENLIFVPNGSMSEFYTLSEDEQKKVIQTTIEEVGDKGIVIAGTGHSGTIQALKMSQFAEDAGAQGVMIVLPYYHIPSKSEMYQHYKTIAEGIDIGVIVYNNIDATKAHIDPKLMLKIAAIPNVIGLKENSTDLAMIRAMMKLDHEGKVRVIIGKGEFWYAAAIPFGCMGFVSSIANFYPDFPLDLLHAGKEGKIKEAWELIEQKYIPLQEFTDEVTRKRETTSVMPPQFTSLYMYLAVRKAAMPLVGLGGSGKTRLPIMPINKSEIGKLKNVLEKLGLSVSK